MDFFTGIRHVCFEFTKQLKYFHEKNRNFAIFKIIDFYGNLQCFFWIY